MAVSSLERMLDQLVETGLINAQQFKELREKKNPDDTLPSVAGVTRKLVRKGVLTEFQAKQLSDGEPQRLVLGEYILIDLLGSGGMGEVYLARHKMMQREVAIKLLVPRSAEVIESIERFKREVRAAAKLSHPNVVSAMDAGLRGGQYYLVMEYVKGRNLASLVKLQSSIRLDRALDYAIQAGQGLEYAHRQGVIHRDVKPSNLLLGEDGTVKVADLGLSRVLQCNEEITDVNDEGDGLTSSGMIMGTVDFMAPEQAVTPRDADERADIYGLGCTLYFLATGGTVFRGDTPMARLIAHRELAVPAITEALPTAPPLLDTVLARMLAKDPDDRYPTIGDALRDLRSCLRQCQEGQPNLAKTELLSPEQPASPRRSTGIIIGALIAVSAAVTGLNGYLSSAPNPVAGSASNDGSPGNPATKQNPASEPARPAPTMHEAREDAEPVDVLDILDLDNARLNGEGWHFENGRELLVMGQAHQVRLGLPVIVPETYWLSLDVRRVPDTMFAKGPFVVGLPVGNSECFAAIDAHRATGARTSFLGNDRFTGATLCTSRYSRIHEDEFVTIRIQVNVRADDIAAVQVTVGDAESFEWEGDPADIEIADGWSSDWPEQVFIATNLETQYVIRKILVGAGSLPPEGPEVSADAAAANAVDAAEKQP